MRQSYKDKIEDLKLACSGLPTPVGQNIRVDIDWVNAIQAYLDRVYKFAGFEPSNITVTTGGLLVAFYNCPRSLLTRAIFVFGKVGLHFIYEPPDDLPEEKKIPVDPSNMETEEFKEILECIRKVMEFKKKDEADR